jgi:hypothetical protein
MPGVNDGTTSSIPPEPGFNDGTTSSIPPEPTPTVRTSSSIPPSRYSPTPPSLVQARPTTSQPARATPVRVSPSELARESAQRMPPPEERALRRSGPRKLTSEEELSRARSAPTQRLSPTPPSLVAAKEAAQSERRSVPLRPPTDDEAGAHADGSGPRASGVDLRRSKSPSANAGLPRPRSPSSEDVRRSRPSPSSSPVLPEERGSRPSPSPTGPRRKSLLPVQTRGSMPPSVWQGRGSSGSLPGPERRSSGRISAPITTHDVELDAAPAEVETAWWIVVAHTLGAAALGSVDLARLGSLELALAVVPLFAAMGLITGILIAGLERLVRDRPWWLVAVVLTAPTLLVYVPVAGSLFEGAYAQTLPLAGVAPYVLPPVLWLGSAIVVAIFRRLLRSRDLTTRAIVVLLIAGAMGAIIFAERNVLGSGYPKAHIGATLALIVLAGCGVRVTRRGGVSYLGAAVLAGLTIGGAIIACLGGLQSQEDRQLLATYGNQSRDLVTLWRSVLDFDRDGASRVLGGGDCDDFDPLRHPGAFDKPQDGIDQDCDGHDAELPALVEQPVDAAAKAQEVATWRATPEVMQLLERTRDMHVLLISVDALRADVLAPDAAHRDDFPVITKLLDESVWFTRAFAPAAGTDISLATFLTGRFDPFQPIGTTLPEALRAAGRATFAALPAEVQRYAGETMLRRGIDRFVTVYTDWGKKDVGDHISAPATTNEGLKAFDGLGDKTGFIWLHYFDVHEHHQISVPNRLRDAVHDGGTAKKHAYRALLKAIDNDLGRLFDELGKRELFDRTIIVFVSDHGESLGDDPRIGDTHGKVTYAPLVRIPIALRIPGVTGGQRTEQISLVDLAPTLLTLTGIAHADMEPDGIDLLPVLLDAPERVRPAPRPIAIHEELQWSVVDWPHQLIVRPADNVIELYDLDQDPAQQSDLSATVPEVVSRLKGLYAQFPRVAVDRTANGRSERERIARQRPNRAP